MPSDYINYNSLTSSFNNISFQTIHINILKLLNIFFLKHRGFKYMEDLP